MGLTAALVRLGGPVVREDHQRGLSGVRACAALSVIAYHALSSSPNVGFDLSALRNGVAVFFVLSGFLLFRPIGFALHRGSAFDLRRYGLSRAFRILPLFVFVFTLILIKAGWSLDAWWAGVTFTGPDLLSVGWSLADEVRFYLLLPALYVLALLFPRGHRLPVVLVGVCLLTTASAILDWRDPPTAEAAVKFNLFGAGMLAAGVLVLRPSWLNGRGLLPIGALVFAAGLWLVAHEIPFGDLTLGLGTALLVALISVDRGAALGYLIALRPVVFLGEISYGLYLWHQIIHLSLVRAGVLSTNFGAGFLELTAATVLISTGTYYLLERPSVGLGAWLARWRRAWPPAPQAAVHVPLEQ